MRVRPGSMAGEAGMWCAATRPRMASATQLKPTWCAPISGTAMIRPPATLPSRMATKVPISTTPLAPVSSRSLMCCGR
ncbi:hypothetical protein D9M68_848730 [compost metagenome]